jgi:putative transposase
VRVPRAWGKSGRVNAVAHLERRSCGGWALGYALLEGRCGTGEVVAYLEGLSREVAREGVRGVVFLDNAPFHRSRGFREAVERWRGRGLEVAYLPRYSPHLNPVETIWRRVKGFLMPRRHYRSVEELRGRWPWLWRGSGNRWGKGCCKIYALALRGCRKSVVSLKGDP